MDRRTAIKHLGGVASALLLTDALHAQALPAASPAAATPPRPQPAHSLCRRCLTPMTRWSHTSTPQRCTCTTTSTIRPM
jgi:hypothetical protein